MRVLLVIFVYCMITAGTFGQTRYIEHVSDSLYRYEVYTMAGELEQKGWFIRQDDGKFKKHGIWENKQGLKARYNKGKRLWLELADGTRYSQEELKRAP